MVKKILLMVVKFFYSSFKYIFSLLLKFFWKISKLILKYVKTKLVFVLNYFNIKTKPYHEKINSTFVYVFEKLLFVFISIPWLICGEFIKPVLYWVLLLITPFFKKYSWFFLPIFNAIIWVFDMFKNMLYGIYKFFISFFWFYWSILTGFLFFSVYRKRDYLLPKLEYTILLIIKLYIFYFLFYKNYWGYAHNFLFSKILNPHLVCDLDSYWGLLCIFIELLNFDNLLMIVNIIVFKLGLSIFFLDDTNMLLLKIGAHWIELNQSFKSLNTSNSYLMYICDPYLNFMANLFLNGGFYTFFSEDWNMFALRFGAHFLRMHSSSPILNFYNSTPIFFYFGVLFFSTVILSWVFFSYLGLYGIFKLNFITLSLFWISLLFSMGDIFINQKVYIIKLCGWFFLNFNIRIDCYFLIDTISFSFMLLTTTIALFVFIYAFSYFRYEPLVDRFLLFLLSFVISMLFLVSSGNLLMLFLGWELIGFTSFCLINFWTTKTTTLKSAFKAFTFNKFSDFFMFVFLVSVYSVYYTFDILSLNNQICKYEPLIIYIFGTPISFLEFLSMVLLGAAFIKSAQIGGHTWLPDSMEAPVPASSLIHSATLVSAGVYLILRFNFLFDATQFAKFVIPVVGSLTAAYGGICAIAQSDVKKTLAYSTISHCGFLMVLCSTEMNEFTIIYLYVHGFFKAGVFMCIGNILRITRGYQDNRRMGGLLKYLPFEYFCAVIGVLNLAGLPFTFGFFIKHLLLISLEKHIYIYYFVMFHSLIGAFAGLFYSYRLINYIFNDFKKADKNLYIGLNKMTYNSLFYTNSSLGATTAIFFLFLSAFVITYFLIKCLLLGNFVFSDFMNTTFLTNYYSIINSSNGFLINFSYINYVVILILMVFCFSKYKKIYNNYNFFKILFFGLLLFIFFIIFYNFL